MQTIPVTGPVVCHAGWWVLIAAEFSDCADEWHGANNICHLALCSVLVPKSVFQAKYSLELLLLSLFIMCQNGQKLCRHRPPYCSEVVLAKLACSVMYQNWTVPKSSTHVPNWSYTDLVLSLTYSQLLTLTRTTTSIIFGYHLNFCHKFSTRCLLQDLPLLFTGSECPLYKNDHWLNPSFNKDM